VRSALSNLPVIPDLPDTADLLIIHEFGLDDVERKLDRVSDIAVLLKIVGKSYSAESPR
jgi:hypothetical protein